MDPNKALYLCTERREFRKTTTADIQLSLDDKRRGGGPRVGPFQESIPGCHWEALPKYDLETKARSCAFNERMHVEWENHVDHILENNGELPIASVVAKAGFRSCAPCCRDMLALARPTGKTFIMVDLADDDTRGTFHFVCGDKYLPVPKEALEPNQVKDLKKIVMEAQAGKYQSSVSIHEAVMKLQVPIDEKAQSLYLYDQALLPAGSATNLKGNALLQVLHAEHFARLAAEYGASILRDPQQPVQKKDAIRACRTRAQHLLFAAWSPHLQLSKSDLHNYSTAAVMPLLPDEHTEYAKFKYSASVPRPPVTTAVQRLGPTIASVSSRASKRRWHLDPQHDGNRHFAPQHLGVGMPLELTDKILQCRQTQPDDDEAISTIAASTAAPDDCTSTLHGEEDCWSDIEDVRSDHT